LNWTSTSTDLDVRGIQLRDARFCVNQGFFPSNSAPGVGDRAQVCAPALDCSFSNCAVNTTTRPQWDGLTGNSDGDPLIERDVLRGPGEEVLVLAGAADGSYLFGAMAFTSTLVQDATMRIVVDGVERGNRSFRFGDDDWHELFQVVVVNGNVAVQALSIVEPPAPQCTIAADCGPGETCTNQVCVASPQCVVDADCGANRVCNAGTCEAAPPPECTVDADCNAGERCQGGSCVVAGSGPSLRAQLTWGSAGDLDVRGIKADGTGRFCVGNSFFPGNGTAPPGALAQFCTPAQDCSFSTCREGSLSRVDWDGVVGVTAGDPAIDIDDLNGFGPENLTVASLPDGDYLFGAAFFSGATPQDATLRIAINGVEQGVRTRAAATNGTWTEMFRVTVVGGVATVTGLIP